MVIGTASATLTGLMFVVSTLIAGLDTHTSTLDAGISAFTTPTIAHFCAVLVLAGALSAPWPSFTSVGILLGLFGVAMALYLATVARRMMRVPDYATPLKDWLWYLAFPLIAYIVIIVAAFALPAYPAFALYGVGAAMIALMLLAIHNAWDLVTYLAVQRSHAQKPEPHSKSRRSRRSDK